MALNREVPLGIKLLICLIFVVGFSTFAFVVVDATWTRLLITKNEIIKRDIKPSSDAAPKPAPAPASAPTSAPVLNPASVAPVAEQGPTLMEASRKSIVLVATSKCSGGSGGHGTGFVVKPGLAVTNAHVVNGCNSITLIDFQGNQRSAKIVGIGNPKTPLDLAILSFNDGQESLPPLNLAGKTDGKSGDKIQTIGYPLVAVESGQNSPSPSNEGVIASYDINSKLYYSQGMNINPGNSGGPVFLVNSRKVIGVATAKSSDMNIAEGVGIFVPVNELRDFVSKKGGGTLP